MMDRRSFTKGTAAVAAGGALLGTTPARAATRERGRDDRIDRRAVVARHAVVRRKSDPETPLQVGNGRFAFGADVTGLQTFQAYATLSDWGWHRDPLPAGTKPSDFQGQTWDTHGRPVRYAMPDPAHPAISQWLIGSPNRANLGRVGLVLTTKAGRPATEDDLTHREQRLDLWTGVLTSTFRLDGETVRVETSCHPHVDALAVRIDSRLIAQDRLRVFLELPYTSGESSKLKFAAPAVGAYDRPDAHASTLGRVGDGRRSARITHAMDDLTYHVGLRWQAGGTVARDGDARHRYVVTGTGAKLRLTALFSRTAERDVPEAAAVARASAARWPRFWRSGGAIDLSGSRDRRWKELERRIVLSQYLTAVNGAGSTPPQESGLANDGWYGKFHMEMYWWHGAHFALWNRWPLLRRSLDVYDRFLPKARALARDQGYRGARWPKMTDPSGAQAPGEINATLIWQQPHPIFFAELDHRAHPGRRTLLRWRDVVFATADFMASFAHREDGEYVLGPPLYPVSENTKPKETKNPAFELSYWRFGLRLAQEWRRRLGMKPHPRWQRVLDGLAPLPQEDGRYVLYEGVQDMWSKFNFEHPALTGILGWLPGDGVDPKVAARTTDKIDAVWKLDEMWGWDFPMMAMNAARLGRPERAVELLLHDQFRFRDNGMPTGGSSVPVPYFPASGGLLYAVALMARGWDGSEGHAPGFPRDWDVRVEGLDRAI
ncbi:hypothetical protein [Patulibacter sp. SYSU D01012]|uniref:hypothetical protein n=1 Tax=Patulibacter sp. SYSU D01012 TaxID=2817381 RepID=UPI001B315AB0|nr:hypothetical protein [Patulibacter sp. SYSU D01012]